MAYFITCHTIENYLDVLSMYLLWMTMQLVLAYKYALSCLKYELPCIFKSYNYCPRLLLLFYIYGRAVWKGCLFTWPVPFLPFLKQAALYSYSTLSTMPVLYSAGGHPVDSTWLNHSLRLLSGTPHSFKFSFYLAGCSPSSVANIWSQKNKIPFQLLDCQTLPPIYHKILLVLPSKH